MKLALHDIKRLETAVRQCPDGISFAQGALRAGGVPQEIKDAIKKILDTDKADHYGDVRGLKELRVALSDFINSQCGVIVPESSVLVTHGTTGAIANILHQLIEPGEEVLLPEPTYPAYWNMVLMARGVPVHTQVFEKENCGWKFSVDRLKESITEKTKAIALTNPSNPLGYCFSHDELCEVTELAEQRNLYVIVDEVYADHVFEGEFNSAVKFALKSRHVIKTGSFSKNFAMSGWRVGYLIADPLLVRDLWAVQDAQVCAPSLIAQFAALHAITHPELLVEMIEKVKKSRD
ncbi:pyridoxal phosphate-dependent aminotransferase, partial [bacterium]|nr:pyridoxal phosphate-dependent aminotransferase [bacterium]